MSWLIDVCSGVGGEEKLNQLSFTAYSRLTAALSIVRWLVPCQPHACRFDRWKMYRLMEGVWLVKICVVKMLDYCESRNLELKDDKGKVSGTFNLRTFNDLHS